MAPLSKSARPQIVMPLQPLDYALEVLAVFGLMTLLGISIFCFDQLPAQIPTHFDFDGQPDKVGSKKALWILPALGLVIFSFMTFINRRPEGFNYMVKITPENAERQYTMATRLIRVLKAFIMVLFAILVWSSIQIARGQDDRLGWGFVLLPVFTLGTAIFYIFRSVAQK